MRKKNAKTDGRESSAARNNVSHKNPKVNRCNASKYNRNTQRTATTNPIKQLVSSHHIAEKGSIIEKTCNIDS